MTNKMVKSIESPITAIQSGDGSGPPATEPTLATEVSAQQQQTPPAGYVASIFVSPGAVLPPDFARTVQDLERTVKMPIWLLVQNAGGKFGLLDEMLVERLLANLDDLPEKNPVALLVDSPGGFAPYAYQIATILRNHCGGFIVIVPRYAKSAATLLALGADTILLGRHGELGPLDAQFEDPEREEYLSALDEVQALERLHAFALGAIDRTMYLLLQRTKKKVETLLPMTLRFVSDMMCPLFKSIDAVHYTQMSRALKVAEGYAIRLLQNRYPLETAERIARHLVENYPEHGFVIDASEAVAINPSLVTLVSDEQHEILKAMRPYLAQLTAIGIVREAPTNG